MLSDAPLRAILLDVGGPIIDERPDYAFEIEGVRQILAEELGRQVELSEVIEALQRGIVSWSPSIAKSALWHFLKPDVERTKAAYREAVARFFGRKEDVVLMEGVREIVPILAQKYKLALAGNQPKQTKEKLARTGLMKYFASAAVSADIGFSKPDSRFFLEICRRLEEPVENCCMVGDRLDNDIYPANVLGMRTIWIRIGPHATQQPRIPEDVPDATIEHMSRVPEIIEGWRKLKG